MNIKINTLSTQIFALFWITFGLLLFITLSIPSLDKRTYTELKGAELSFYQKEILSSIRNNKIARLLVTPEPFVIDPTESIHPLLVDKHAKIIGADERERKYVQHFVYESTDITKPLVKNFNNIQIAGPFIVHLSVRQENGKNADEPFMLYYSRKVVPQSNLNFILDRPGLLILFVMLFSSPLLWWLAWSISKPIRRLQQSANRVAKGDFTLDKQIESKGVVELRQLGRNFNKMTAALDEILSSRQSLLYSISHELRTPLTRLQLAAALLRRRVGETGELSRIETEIERLDKMIGDLLELSRNEIKAELERHVFPIQELWENVLADAKFEAEQRHIQLSVKNKISEPQEYLLNGNMTALMSALENVVRNALKYTKDKIEIFIHLHEDELCIHIDDNGAGVTEGEYNKIFTPFYRVDNVITRQVQGTGLGLAIVQKIIIQHQGSVFAEHSHLGGLRVIMKVPLWQS